MVILVGVDGNGHDLLAVLLRHGLQLVCVLLEVSVFLQQTNSIAQKAFEDHSLDRDKNPRLYYVLYLPMKLFCFILNKVSYFT